MYVCVRKGLIKLITTHYAGMRSVCMRRLKYVNKIDYHHEMITRSLSEEEDRLQTNLCAYRVWQSR